MWSRIANIALGIVEEVLTSRRAQRERELAAVARLEAELNNLGRVAKGIPAYVDAQLAKLKEP